MRERGAVRCTAADLGDAGLVGQAEASGASDDPGRVQD